MKKWIVFTCCVLFFTACKKKTNIDDKENETCENTSYAINDTTIALITQLGSAATQIVKIENAVSTVVASQSFYEFWGASISPNKQKFICFRSTTGNPVKVYDYENAELWMFNIDGSNGHMILSRTGNGWRAMGMADWAPDNNHIVLAAEKNEPADANKPHWSIYVTDTTGATPIKMNSRLGRFTHPRFGNGNMNLITYSAWPSGLSGVINEYRSEIYYATVTSGFLLSGETRVTNDVQYDYSPSFSPDNLKITFCKTTSMAAGTAINIHTRNISTGTDNMVVSDNSVNENPYWCPTNGRIYFANKTATYCFGNCKRILENGTENAPVYRIMNRHFSHISIR